MSSINIEFSEDELDFFHEIINVGTGNASCALERMLKTPVNIIELKVNFLTAKELLSEMDILGLKMVAVKMKLTGEAEGDLFFAVPDDEKSNIICLAKRAIPGNENTDIGNDLTFIEEVGNILTGVYLTAINDFCGLELGYTEPIMSTGILSEIINEDIASVNVSSNFFFIDSKFNTEKNKSRMFFIIILSTEAVQIFANSIVKARKRYEDKANRN